jgi:hypothetical protein
MMCALENTGVLDSAYQTLTIPDSDEHSFHYWGSPDGIPGSGILIKDHVITFLDEHLK